jgi:DNA-directed RNA polymerase subunit K/omega
MFDLAPEELSQMTGNLYAAVVVMSRRARQVTDEQKVIIDSEREVVPVIETKENEDFDEVEIDREALGRSYHKFPKPVQVAIDEMAQSKIHWEIPAPEAKP